jgi:List-Bact-rpt repeat protein
MTARRMLCGGLFVALAIACSGGKEGGSSQDTPPTAPGNVHLVAASASTIDLAWLASTDDHGVAEYLVYRGGSAHHNTTATALTDTGLAASTQYCYTVAAIDTAAQPSPQSAQLCATTGPATGGQFALTVSKSGAGSGTITSSPTGINCGNDCSESYAGGATVALTATASSGSTFASWSACDSTSGTTCTVQMSAAKTVTATFNVQAVNYTLTVSKSGAGSGSVTSSPAGINCGSDCSELYAGSTSVALTATASSGSTFAGWSGCDVLVLNGQCQMTMNASKTVTAAFSVQTSQTVTLQALASNCALYSSLDSAAANTAHPNCYPAAGINSFWNFAGGSALAAAGAVKFNTATLAGKTIESATLKLEVSTAGVGYYPKNFKIGAVYTSWNPATLTWNAMASWLYYTASWLTYSYPTYSGQVYNINLTTTVQSWASGTYVNNGLGILSADYTSPGNVTSFDIYEFYAPTLTVTYH